MPVTARRMSLQRGVSPITSEPGTRPIGRSLARHRKPKPAPATPRTAAAMTLSVGLAVSGGAAISAAGSPQTAGAATTPAGAARGAQPIKTKPALRFGDSGTAVKYVQYRLRIPMSSWYGAATRNAVSNFQRAINLPRTGTMNQRTWNSLFYIAKHPTTKKRAAAPTTSNFHTRVLREAAKLKGTPYVWGGTTPRGFDCSGYTGYVYKKAGKTLPRTSRSQYSATKHLSRSSAKPGDLVFFKNSSGRVYHVGVYAGGSMLWHSSKPGTPVAKSKIWSSRVAFGRA